ncbi:hypothetical protein Pan258_17980 [Symmachiella dynata]|uniref:hypothetical protein n=1 Tax=Symmachiella dynata TaxID=2527995 RepID=UPI00118837D5|nr:hypothetical protein [Symmachiella dynata]QDT47762.1 hypothetical protein Pan258_17980 [Symmachiella dynata]
MNSRSARTSFYAAILLLTATGTPQLFASGSDFTRTTKDLTLTVDSRWAGGRYGGYAPIRIRLRNTGKPQELLFRFESDGYAKLPRVQQRITIGQNETRQFTMAVPMVSESGYGSYAGGQLTVRRNGRVIKNLSDSISLAENGSDSVNCPALLVVSTKKVDCEPFSSAANSLSAAKGMTSPYGSSSSEDFQVIDPIMLPQSAVDYSGLDIMALSLETLKKIPDGARSAINNWVRTGGKLLVYETGAAAADVPELRGLLELTDAETWRHAPINSRKPIKIITEEELQGIGVSEIGTTPTEVSGDYDWENSPNTFAFHPQVLGYVIAMPDNPFPGTPQDWAWMMNSLTPDSWRWTTRQGISTRQADSSFADFAIPGVGGVPKIAFIVLISAFTIVIGPLNYFFLKRRQQLYLLVVTIPSIAFLTSCALFAYAAVSDGFGVTSRTRSVTLLDQRTKTAVALGRTALYAGVAPSDGLRFDADTAVFPIWSAGQDSPQGSVDWTNGQHFSSGWIRSRTPMQFLSTVCRTERGRLEITPSIDSATVNVANGLAWNIETLVVIDDEGNTFLGSELPAGDSNSLKRTKAAEVVSVLKRQYTTHPLEIQPSGAAPVTSSTSITTYSGYPSNEYSLNLNYTDGNLERTLSRLLKPRNTTTLTDLHRSYIAILSENPGIELGVENTDPKGDFHVIWGQY